MEDKGIMLAYLAGALDGDGSFSLLKGTSHSSISPLYYPMIQFANAVEDIVLLFHKQFGGYVGKRAAYKGKDGSNRLPSFHWKQEKSIKCLPTLEDLIPYLIIKKERARFLRDYILDNPFIRGSNRLDSNIIARRERAYLKMRSFNDNANINGELLSKAKRQDSDNPLFWSYIAGVMDTDGSFSLKKEIRKSGGSKSAVYTPTILLTMVDCRAIYHLMNNFIGGNMLVVNAKSTNNGFCYRFNITSRKNAAKFLNNIITYLYIKKHIAQELLNFCLNVRNMNGPKGVSEEQILFREKYYNLIKSLNNGVYKSPLIDSKLLPGDAGDNEGQAGNTVQPERSKQGDLEIGFSALNTTEM